MPDPVTLKGTVKPDGTLELDEKVTLPPGPVQVMLQPLAVSVSPSRTVLEVLADIRRDQQARGHVPRTREAIDAEVSELRQAGEKEMTEIERLYRECQRAREQAGNGTVPGP